MTCLVHFPCFQSTCSRIVSPGQSWMGDVYCHWRLIISVLMDDSENMVRGQGGGITPDDPGHGHFFIKKTFHKPTYCHHCTDMLWGLIGQGFVCEGKVPPRCQYKQPVERHLIKIRWKIKYTRLLIGPGNAI